MTTAIFQEPVLESGVREFLQRHGAEESFHAVCELVRSHFPGPLPITVCLQEDPDEEGRVKLLLVLTLPAVYSLDLLQQQVRRYHEEFVQHVPLAHCPLFGLFTDFAQE